MTPDADTERRLSHVEKRVEDHHERLRPIEARVVGDGWTNLVGRVEKAEQRDEERARLDDERWNRLDREVVKLRTTVVVVGAALAVVLPLVNEFLMRLIGK